MLNEIFNRELRVMELLSVSMHIFLANFKRIAKVLLFIFLPLAFLNALIANRMADSMLLLASLTENVTESMGIPDNVASVANAFMGNATLQTATRLFLEPVGIIAVAKIVQKYLQGQEMHLGEMIGEAMGYLGWVIVAGLIALAFTTLGLMAFVIPGIYLSVIWIFYVYAIGLRGKKGWNSLTYSGSLVKGKWWGTVACILIVSVFVSGWTWMIGNLFVLGEGNLLSEVLYQWVAYFITAISYIFYTVLFLNREATVLYRRDIAYGTGNSNVIEGEGREKDE